MAGAKRPLGREKSQRTLDGFTGTRTTMGKNDTKARGMNISNLEKGLKGLFFLGVETAPPPRGDSWVMPRELQYLQNVGESHTLNWRENWPQLSVRSELPFSLVHLEIQRQRCRQDIIWQF